MNQLAPFHSGQVHAAGEHVCVRFTVNIRNPPHAARLRARREIAVTVVVHELQRQTAVNR
jgi:hypothetical protein